MSSAAISGLPEFLLYFVVALALVGLYLFLYTLVTAHNEFALIRQNVLSAALSLGMSLIGFALPPLLQLRKVPPARVLRRNLEPPPLRYAFVYGSALAALLALLYWLVRDPKLLWYVAAATFGTFVVLMAAGWVLVRILSSLRGSVGISWRYGMANIARRGRDSDVGIVVERRHPGRPVAATLLAMDRAPGEGGAAQPQ